MSQHSLCGSLIRAKWTSRCLYGPHSFSIMSSHPTPSPALMDQLQWITDPPETLNRPRKSFAAQGERTSFDMRRHCPCVRTVAVRRASHRGTSPFVVDTDQQAGIRHRKLTLRLLIVKHRHQSRTFTRTTR